MSDRHARNVEGEGTFEHGARLELGSGRTAHYERSDGPSLDAFRPPFRCLPMSMPSTDATSAIPEDFDGFLLDAIPTTDGVWALYGIDDDRPLAAWSSYHAARCVDQLVIARARVKAAEWALTDVQARGHAACIAKAGAHLARMRADLADWEAQGRRLEAARKVTYGAWTTPVIES